MSGNRMLYGALALMLAGSPLAAQQRVELPAKDRAAPLTARTLFQVGAVDGEEYETFGNVNDVAFDSRGNLYILDASAYHVVVFDAKGKFVRMIGRQGEGPGEFGFPSALAVLPSGELVVNDAAKANLQVFSAKGEYIRSVTLDEDLGRAVGRMRLAPDGGIVTETMQLRRLADPAQRANLQRLQMPPRSVTWLSVGESVTGRRLYNAPPREARMSAPQQANGGAARIAMSISAFEPSLLWTPLPGGGVAAMNSADYRVGIMDAHGKPLRWIERPITPRKVTDADKKRFLENRKSGAAAAGGGGAVIAFSTRVGGSGGSGGAAPPPVRVDASDIREADVNWGETIPVVTALGTDSFGRLWIQRSAAGGQDGPIDLVDSSFRYLGTLAGQQMPRAFGPDGRLAYVTRDDLDVQHVVVRQIGR